MAAQRCSTHGLNLPLRFERCPICNAQLDRMQNADPDPDWPLIVAEANEPAVLTTEQKVENWRLESALRLGYPVETAESLAADTSVDLNLLRVLVEREHCPLELAARIA